MIHFGKQLHAIKTKLFLLLVTCLFYQGAIYSSRTTKTAPFIFLESTLMTDVPAPSSIYFIKDKGGDRSL